MTKGTATTTVPFPASSQPVSGNWNLHCIHTGSTKTGWTGEDTKEREGCPLYHIYFNL